MHKLNWTDQPKDLEQAEPLLRMFLKNIGAIVEVRQAAGDDHLFISSGNLFGSQTIRVLDHKQAFRVLDAMAHLEDGQEIKLTRFPGAELMEEVTA